MESQQAYAVAEHIDAAGCACPACLGNMDPNEASLDPQAGGAANGKEIWTADEAAAYLNRNGTSWLTTGVQRGDADANTITFGFFDTQAQLADNGYVYFLNGQGFGLNEYFGFGAFSTAQRDATRESIQYWDDLVAVSFKETPVGEGDINFGNVMNRPGTQAYARLPGSSVSSNAEVNAQAYNIVGDVWVTGTTASNFQLDEGLYGMNTLTHEIGHSLGLSHPGGYNFAPGFTVNYANGAEYAQDARNYTIMSYWNPRDMGSTPTGVPTRDFDWSLMSIAYGSTPMVHDILAAHNMYGADPTTRVGDTVYGFNSTAGRDAFDFDKTPWPTMAIYDAGGNDTLDASGYKVTQVIDLTPGSLSSIGGITYEDALATLSFEEVNANRAAAGYAPISQATYDANMAAFAADPDFRGRLTDNVGIAYGTVIENAKGGSGDDTMIGNQVANRLEGNGGADTLRGADGVDLLIGGAGDDIFVAELTATKVDTKRGDLSLDVILDFGNGADLIDLSGIDANSAMEGNQAFTWAGKSSGNGVGELSYKTYGNLNAAENALGVDLDDSLSAGGHVTVVFGNTDSDKDAEFAIVLLNTKDVDPADFMFG